MQASKQGARYPRYEFLFYGWYSEQWWIGSKQEQEQLQMLFNGNCSAAQRENVIGPAMAPLQNEFITNCSKIIDSGIVSESISECMLYVSYMYAKHHAKAFHDRFHCGAPQITCNNCY